MTVDSYQCMIVFMQIQSFSTAVPKYHTKSINGHETENIPCIAS